MKLKGYSWVISVKDNAARSFRSGTPVPLKTDMGVDFLFIKGVWRRVCFDAGYGSWIVYSPRGTQKVLYIED